MAKKDKRSEEIPVEEEFLDDEEIVIEFADEEGNVFYYVQEMIIPVNGEDYALLVEVHEEGDEHHCHDENCDCEDDEGDVRIAKIVINEDGEEEYIEPTDEEFEAVQEAYERLMYEADEDE